MKKNAQEKRYLKWIDSLPCSVANCPNDSTHHHVIGVGFGCMGKTAPHWQAIPLCELHHTGDQGIHKLGVLEWQERYGHQLKHLGWTMVIAKERNMIEVDIAA